MKIFELYCLNANQSLLTPVEQDVLVSFYNSHFLTLCIIFIGFGKRQKVERGTTD